MPPARKRGSQKQGRQLQACTACRCHGGCRRRQMTMTSLHGSSSFVALKKRKKPTPSRNCKRGGGWFWVGRNPPRLAIASEGVGGFGLEETHPGLQLHARGWVFVIWILYCTVIVSNH